jgi:hypothetical protein
MGSEFPHSGALGLLLQSGQIREARTWLSRSKPAEPEYQEARRQLRSRGGSRVRPQTGPVEERADTRSAPTYGFETVMTVPSLSPSVS